MFCPEMHYLFLQKHVSARTPKVKLSVLIFNLEKVERYIALTLNLKITALHYNVILIQS